MKTKTKIKLVLKQEYLEDLYNTYPNAFEKKEKTIKINNNEWFIKLMKRTHKWQEFILKNLWVTYIWYMDLLLNSMDYDNKVDFWELRRIWIKEWMIKVARKKFLEHNIIKKVWSSFYVSPWIALKWEKMNPDLITLFNFKI